jgi:hypothetical protein
MQALVGPGSCASLSAACRSGSLVPWRQLEQSQVSTMVVFTVGNELASGEKGGMCGHFQWFLEVSCVAELSIVGQQARGHGVFEPSLLVVVRP